MALCPSEGLVNYRKGLSWTWHCRPPPLHHPPAAMCPGDLWLLLLPLITKGVMKENPLQPCFPSRVFTLPKPQRGKCLIIDLSSLNLHIPCPSFKMLDANKIRHAIPKQTFFYFTRHHRRLSPYSDYPHIPKICSFFHPRSSLLFPEYALWSQFRSLIFTTVITPALKLLHS